MFAEWVLGGPIIPLRQRAAKKAKPRKEIISVEVTTDDESQTDTLRVTYPRTRQTTPPKQVRFNGKPKKPALKPTPLESADEADTENTSESEADKKKVCCCRRCVRRRRREKCTASDTDETTTDTAGETTEDDKKKKNKGKNQQESSGDETSGKSDSGTSDGEGKKKNKGKEKKKKDEKKEEKSENKDKEDKKEEKKDDEKEEKREEKKGDDREDKNDEGQKDEKGKDSKAEEKKDEAAKPHHCCPSSGIPAHLIAPVRAQVVQTEAVIEGADDPRPNAFYDAAHNVMRVYYGPVYGNHDHRSLYPRHNANGLPLSMGMPYPAHNPHY